MSNEGNISALVIDARAKEKTMESNIKDNDIVVMFTTNENFPEIVARLEKIGISAKETILISNKKIEDNNDLLKIFWGIITVSDNKDNLVEILNYINFVSLLKKEIHC